MAGGRRQTHVRLQTAAARDPSWMWCGVHKATRRRPQGAGHKACSAGKSPGPHSMPVEFDLFVRAAIRAIERPEDKAQARAESWTAFDFAWACMW